MRKNKGITLIALVVTILILLILAGVSISMLTGENGIIEQAKNSKEKTEIGEEKEYIALAVNNSRMKSHEINKNGVITRELLQSSLDELTGEGKTEVTGSILFSILFVESDRTYYITETGEITAEIEDDETIFKYTESGYITGVQDKYLNFEEQPLLPSKNEKYNSEERDRYASLGNIKIAEGAYYYIISLKEEVGTKLDIPSEIKGIRIVGIADGAFKEITNLSEVVLTNSIEVIGSYSFSNTPLQKITMSQNIKTIGEGAFDDTMIENIELPEGLSYIGARAFSGSNIKNIILPSTITEISISTFSYCHDLLSVTIPESVKSIEDSAFYCSGLESVNIPDSVTKIGEYAFRECDNLTSVTLSNNIQTIEIYSFAYNSKLNKIVFPESVKRIEKYAFLNCTNLSNITVTENLEYIGCGAFDDTNIESSLPTGEVYLGKVFFAYIGNMPSNTNINIKEGTKSIAYDAFREAKNLKNVTIPNTVNNIGHGAFASCTGLTSLIIPDSVTTIESWGLSNCHNISKIYIPNSVQTIEQGGFDYWYSWQTINCEAESKPDGWESSWNRYWNRQPIATVNWGVKK